MVWDLTGTSLGSLKLYRKSARNPKRKPLYPNALRMHGRTDSAFVIDHRWAAAMLVAVLSVFPPSELPLFRSTTRGRVTALEKDGREELLSCGRLRFAIHGPAPSIANSIQTALAFSAVEGHLSNPSW